MAIGMLNRMPEGGDTSIYDRVTATIDPTNNPPDGMIFHSAGMLEGRFQVFDIWESREHFDRFREERLIPAMKQVVGEDAFAQMPDAEYITVDVHNYVIP
ncbi:MAG: hypothetical protein U0R52_11885 [Solirubrobacterales bacterium]